IFLDPFDGGGGRRLEKACTELEAVLAIIVPIPARLDELAGGDHGGMADNGDQIPLAARLHTQHGETVFLVVERDALNEPSEDLATALSRVRFHREQLRPTIKHHLLALALHPVSGGHSGNRWRVRHSRRWNHLA